MTEEISGIIGRGLLGVAGLGAGVGVSLQNVEQWLRITSLGAGILVAVTTTVITIWSFVRKNRKQ